MVIPFYFYTLALSSLSSSSSSEYFTNQKKIKTTSALQVEQAEYSYALFSGDRGGGEQEKSEKEAQVSASHPGGGKKSTEIEVSHPILNSHRHGREKERLLCFMT